MTRSVKDQDHVVPSRAQLDALVEGAKAKGRAAREEKDARRRVKDGKLTNLGGAGTKASPLLNKLLRRLERSWRTAYKASFPDTPLAAWEGRERGQVTQLVEKYNGEIAEQGLQYVAKNWEALSERFSKAPQVPTPGWLLACHDSLIPEASQFGKVQSVYDEWKRWWKDHPDDDPPEDLESRFEAHRKLMEQLGLV